MLMCMY